MLVHALQFCDASCQGKTPGGQNRQGLDEQHLRARIARDRIDRIDFPDPIAGCRPFRCDAAHEVLGLDAPPALSAKF